MNANNTIKTNNIGSVGQQARLLMRGDRKRTQNRQASMLSRVSAEVGLQ
ncbi:hypothetical protein Cyast_0854 [Cyanobacterium stanieri PCC 7202]|uniref:Uncharacterized protein n=1 Tax=Cyanobacterium stanieri (strain ATCC 29140 / PCC 7202) TaxID=292563 RepID=K9YIP6_CYASC|nr:hypothetical protein Cyast_0854 [Cyanobacterium stanieri PCC 7202]